MKPYIASLLNAIILVVLGIWAYFSSELEEPSITILIPVAIGVLLLILIPGVKKESKIPAHIAVLLTVAVFGGLIKPLIGAIGRNDICGVVRVSVMLFSTAIAMVSFVRSFIEVRKQRKLEANK